MLNPISLIMKVTGLSKMQAIVAAFVVVFLAGTTFGGVIVSKFYKAGEIKALELQAERQKKAGEDGVKATQNHYENLLEIERSKIKTVEVTKYVKENPDCDLTRGATGLLNRVRSGVPETTSLTDEEAQAPSTITQQAEIRYHEQCIIEYNKGMSAYNELIDWLGKNYAD